MMNMPLQVLWVGSEAADLALSLFGPCAVRRVDSLQAAASALSEAPLDALVLQAADAAALQAIAHWPALSQAVLDAAVLVLADAVSADAALQLVDLGVQDVLPAAAADAQEVGRALRLALQRKRIERSARKAYATDLATGLPNHTQLLEHMSHLLALREREPAPMALLVLRIEGLATTEAALGTEAANILRRKVAVRLRAGLRASDVVAAIGGDVFAVLLAWIDAPAAGQRVAAKLVQSLQQSFSVAGQERAVAVSAGVSQYPQHGRRAEELLHRALAQATQTAALGRAGFAARIERGPGSAANDEGPDTVT
jgi:diguanylate cyclase (GGDEF)-like protein